MAFPTRVRRAAAVAGLLALTAAPLAGCAGAGLFGSNPQGHAGLTDVTIGFSDAGKIKSVHWIDGKEKQGVRLKADLNTGEVTYSATKVAAFEGFKDRADVEKYVADQWPKLAPDVRKAAVNIISTLAGLAGG